MTRPGGVLGQADGKWWQVTVRTAFVRSGLARQPENGTNPIAITDFFWSPAFSLYQFLKSCTFDSMFDRDAGHRYSNGGQALRDAVNPIALPQAHEP